MKETNARTPTLASRESTFMAPAIAATKLIMFDQPLCPTLLDDGNMKTRSTTRLLQSDSALWQTYDVTNTAALLHRSFVELTALLGIKQ